MFWIPFGGPKTEPQEVRNRPHVTTGAPERVRQQRRAEEQRSALLEKLGLEESNLPKCIAIPKNPGQQ